MVYMKGGPACNVLRADGYLVSTLPSVNENRERDLSIPHHL